MPERISTIRPSSLRERVKEKLLTPGGSLKYLPKFLTNEPASPARYPGKRISIGYSPAPSTDHEQWYLPPDPPPPPPRRVAQMRRSNDIPSSSRSYEEGYFCHRPAERRITSWSPQRPAPSTPPVAERERDPKPLSVHDRRREQRLPCTVPEIHSGPLYDLIQTFSSVWLAHPRIKEAFIPLLRADNKPTRERSPTPGELRLVQNFLDHLPEVHVLVSVGPPAETRSRETVPLDYKRNLNLSSELTDGLETSNPRTRVIYSILIIATLLHEISLWILPQLVHSGNLVAGDVSPDSALIVQHSVFGGVLMIEQHPEEDAQLAFVDSQGQAWMVSHGWLLFKSAEGPDGMPFLCEKGFQRRRAGIVKKTGGLGGGLEGYH